MWDSVLLLLGKMPDKYARIRAYFAFSQQSQNFFQNPLAHIYYSYKQTLGWSFDWILYELILKSLPQLAFIFSISEWGIVMSKWLIMV